MADRAADPANPDPAPMETDSVEQDLGLDNDVLNVESIDRLLDGNPAPETPGEEGETSADAGGGEGETALPEGEGGGEGADAGGDDHAADADNGTEAPAAPAGGQPTPPAQPSPADQQAAQARQQRAQRRQELRKEMAAAKEEVKKQGANYDPYETGKRLAELSAEYAELLDAELEDQQQVTAAAQAVTQEATLWQQWGAKNADIGAARGRQMFDEEYAKAAKKYPSPEAALAVATDRGENRVTLIRAQARAKQGGKPDAAAPAGKPHAVAQRRHPEGASVLRHPWYVGSASFPSPLYSGERVRVRGSSFRRNKAAPHPRPLPRVQGRGGMQPDTRRRTEYSGDRGISGWSDASCLPEIPRSPEPPSG